MFQERRLYSMGLFQALLIIIGLSLDSFVLMMNKGAVVRNLTIRKSLIYALIFSITDVVAVCIGYGISYFRKGIMSDSFEASIACLIILSMGIFLITSAYKKTNIVERLDKYFNEKNCFRLALGTSIDTLFLSVGFSFLGISLARGVYLTFIVTFISVLAALRVGYTEGSVYTRAVGMSGGALMIILSLYLYVVKVMLK